MSGAVLPFVNGRQACGPENAHLFFSPAGEKGEAREQRAARAKAVCATCPVIRDCLTHALTHSEWGVWGGADEEDRVALQHRHGLTRRVGRYSGHWSAIEDDDLPDDDTSRSETP